MERIGASGSNGKRPFYELPSHIKPCSQIIHETRLQLSHPKKQQLPFSDYNLHLNGLEEDEKGVKKGSSISGAGVGNMKPVHTQRPFTPRDSVSLWGVSARKRPPSAITVTRLSNPPDDTDELHRPTSSLGRNVTGYPTIGRGNEFEAKSIFGSLSFNNPQHLSGIEEGDSDEMESKWPTTSEGYLDENMMRVQMKSLTLQTAPSISYQRRPSVALGSINKKEAGGDCQDKSKKPRHSSDTSDMDVDDRGDYIIAREKNCSRKNDDSESPTNKSKTKADAANNPYLHINNLEVAIEYLHRFLLEYATLDKPSKSEVLSILKQIRQIFLHGVHGANSDEKYSKSRRKLLELIFKLVEKNQNDEDVLFWSSFVLLHCNIIGNNLTTVFKMVFKSSKYKDYKDIIVASEYLDVLIKSFSQICPRTQAESMIYGYGTLKFICEDFAILNRVIDLDLISIMSLHLKILNCEMELSEKENVNKIADGILNGTFQLTSILRSVVGEERTLMLVVESGLLEELCITLTWAWVDMDVLSNIMRIMSVVSMDGICCQIMHNNEAFCSNVVRVLKHCYTKDDIMLRLAYFLGNLLANLDDMRIKLYEEPEAFPSVLKVMTHYLDKSFGSPVFVDILIKTTRLIANWILNPFVGAEVCDDSLLSEKLYEILIIGETSVELSYCVMSALNNISFYINYANLNDGTLKISEYIFKHLPSQEFELRAEAMKVLGNLTRNQDVRLMAANYMDNVLKSLDEDEVTIDLIYATCGVLINAVIEEKVKETFLQAGGVERLINVLQRSDDIMVSLITCQVMWNLLISHVNQGGELAECTSLDQASKLKEILLEKMNKVKSIRTKGVELAECDTEDKEEAESSCNFSYSELAEDFYSVAKDLIEKL